jgi:hypothetical protein
MTVYKTISEGLVYPSDLGDILDIGGLDPEIVLITEEDVRSHIKEIRAVLEADGDSYDMTDEEMIADILEIGKQLDAELEAEENVYK